MTACLGMKKPNEIRILFAVTVVAGAGCLGADSFSSDAGRFPKITLRPKNFVIDAARPATRIDSLFIDRFLYVNDVRLRAESLPPGVTVTFVPDVVPTTQRAAFMRIHISDAAAPGDHRIWLRGSGVVVPSNRAMILLRLQ
jgi:hypothetical protein